MCIDGDPATSVEHVILLINMCAGNASMELHIVHVGVVVECMVVECTVVTYY